MRRIVPHLSDAPTQALPPPGSRVAFYSRCATALQSHSSIEGQERQNSAQAAKQGWVEAGRYSDAARSGTTTVGRAGLFQMLAAAERASSTCSLWKTSTA